VLQRKAMFGKVVLLLKISVRIAGLKLGAKDELSKMIVWEVVWKFGSIILFVDKFYAIPLNGMV